MALSTEPSFARTRAIKQSMRAGELPPAGVFSQAASYLVISLAIGLGCALLDRPSVFAAVVIALGIGAILSNVTPIGGLFANVSGVIVAVAAVLVTIVLAAFTDRVLTGYPWIALPVVAAGVLGLDWRFAPRLRARVVLSGIVVIPLVGTGERWAYPAALVWFVGAVLTLWLIERDVRRAATRPIPLVPPRRAAAHPGDLARTAGVALLAGLAFAFLFADATCTWDQDSPLDGGTPRPFEAGHDSGVPSSPDFGPSWSPDDLYRIDPGTGALVPDGDAIDRVPVPGGSIGRDAEAVERDELGRIVVRQSDGSTRTYDRDALGRERVTVEDDDGVRTYVYDDSGDELRITELDENGRPVREYAYDPSRDLTGGDPDTERDEGGATSPTTAQQPSDTTSDGSSWWPWVLAAFMVVAAVVVAALLWPRRRDHTNRSRPRSWAEELADRLDEEGRRRGRGRASGETVVDHADALADELLPDDRLTEVGRIVSAALFGRSAPPDDTRSWAESVVDDATAAHPPPSRSQRRRARRASPADEVLTGRPT
jgi:hypothetical protein